ncbi:MAG: M16 family metallopeptidase [Pseudobdellovibrionaceae bacterium]
MKKILLIVLVSFISQSAISVTADKFKNGAPFFGEQDSSLPRNTVLLAFQGGAGILSVEQQGIALILKEVLKEGPSDQTMSQFKQNLFNLGVEIDTGSEPNMFNVVLRAPSAEQENALQLLKQVLEKPRISEEDFKQYHAKVLAGLKTKFEDMRSVVFYFGPRDLMGDIKQIRTGDTSPGTFEKITYEDFKEAVPKLLNFEGLFVSYIGSEAVVKTKGQFQKVFADRLKAPYKKWKVEKPEPVKLETNRYTLIDKPGATDNQIVYIFPQKVKRDSPQWQVALATMDTLGGGLHGQLGKVLRGERGLTYGASSAFSSSQLPYWLVWTFGGLDKTPGLLTGVPEVVDKYKTVALTTEQLKESKARILNSFKTSTELPKDRLALMGWYYGNGLPTDLVERFPKYLNQVDMKAVNAFRKALQTKVASVYMMGDKDKVLPMLESIGVKKESVRIVPVNEIQ